MLALAACSKAPDSGSAATTACAERASGRRRRRNPRRVAAAHDDAGIAWRKGDVDAAFAAARAENKPVFLYWGAIWCPPCNQVKATIFNRQDFIDRSRFFVPVYIDGDSPSAQKEGARFKVSGYPTMVLFTPDGREITRLPGEVDADQYMRVLAMGMSGSAAGQGNPGGGACGGRGGARAGLTAEDWRMLAYYSWITDEQQLVAEDDLAADALAPGEGLSGRPGGDGHAARIAGHGGGGRERQGAASAGGSGRRAARDRGLDGRQARARELRPSRLLRGQRHGLPDAGANRPSEGD